MAATVELENLETGKKTHHYSVDAREILASKECKYKMTGNVKLNGLATPSGATMSTRPPRRSAEERLAETVTQSVMTAVAELVKQLRPSEPEKRGSKAKPEKPERKGTEDF